MSLDERIMGAAGGLSTRAADALEAASEGWDARIADGVASLATRARDLVRLDPAPEPVDDDEPIGDPYKEDLLRRFAELERRGPRGRS